MLLPLNIAAPALAKDEALLLLLPGGTIVLFPLIIILFCSGFL